LYSIFTQSIKPDTEIVCEVKARLKKSDLPHQLKMEEGIVNLKPQLKVECTLGVQQGPLFCLQVKTKRFTISEQSILVSQFHSSTNTREYASANKYQKPSRV